MFLYFIHVVNKYTGVKTKTRKGKSHVTRYNEFDFARNKEGIESICIR